MKAVKKPAATPMRKSAWKREACLFAYMLLRRLAVQVAVQNRQCTILFCTDSQNPVLVALQNGLAQYRIGYRGVTGRTRCTLLSCLQSAACIWSKNRTQQSKTQEVVTRRNDRGG